MIISLDELLVNKFHRYVGVRVFMDLYTMVAAFPFIISSIEGNSNLDSSREAEASYMLFLTILAPRFCRFCKIFFKTLHDFPTQNNNIESVAQLLLYN